MRIYITILLLFYSLTMHSQSEISTDVEFDNVSLKQVFKSLEKTYNVVFSYQDAYVQEKVITLKNKKRTLVETLEEILAGVNLTFEILTNRYVIITNKLSENSTIYQLENVLINTYLAKGISKNKDASYNIDPFTLEILPGLTEPDVLESIQLLPGVISPNETATGLLVRGGVADQNRIIWDGITMYHKGHLFGMISPFNPNTTKKVTFINKGTLPSYGERVSSVIDITSNTEIENELRASIGANAINGDALMEIPIVKNKMSLSASLRRSYAEMLQTPTLKQLTNKTFQSTKIRNIDTEDNAFSFLDYTLKLNYHPNDKNELYASFISIENTLNYITKDDTNSFNDILISTNLGYGIGWKIHWNDKLTQKNSAFFSKYNLNYNFITTDAANEVTNFEKLNIIYDSGVATELDWNVSEKSEFLAGYQYTLKDVGYSFQNTTPTLSFILDSQQNVVQTHSLYSNYKFKKDRLFDISFGVRGTYFEELNSIKIEPRLLLYKPLTNYLKIQASAEVKNQIINEIDETVLSDLSLENNLWRLVDGKKFPIINAKQASLGLIYSKNKYTIDVDVFHKRINNISALSLGFLNPQNSGFSIGEKKVTGMDVFVEKRIKKFNTWISYSINDSKSRFEDLNNDQYFTSKSSITHAVSMALSYKLHDIQFALGWKWNSGEPFTRSVQDENGLVFNDGINTATLPDYHRLDFSSTYHFPISKNDKLKGKVGVSIRNVYDKNNRISIEYRGNNSINDPVELIEKYAIGITPNVMFRLYW